MDVSKVHLKPLELILIQNWISKRNERDFGYPSEKDWGVIDEKSWEGHQNLHMNEILLLSGVFSIFCPLFVGHSSLLCSFVNTWTYVILENDSKAINVIVSHLFWQPQATQIQGKKDSWKTHDLYDYKSRSESDVSNPFLMLSKWYLKKQIATHWH